MKRADSLLAPLIKNLKLEDAVKLGRIKTGWADIFEKPVSLHMFPAMLKEGELLINVDSPMWMQQLSFYKDKMTDKLQGFGVKAVRLRLGKVMPWEKEKKGEEILHKPITADDRSYIEKTVSPIHDAELREGIKKAIEKSISFKRP
ncbi:MAG: DUF721 domain-containing protein [Nitrospirae bacterium]|nr:DUF721 domain-containing protein [Nitrospirota bacterium]